MVHDDLIKIVITNESKATCIIEEWQSTPALIISACTVFPESSTAAITYESISWIPIMSQIIRFIMAQCIGNINVFILGTIYFYCQSLLDIPLLLPSSLCNVISEDLPIFDFSSKGLSSWKFPIRDSPKDIENPSHRHNRFTKKRVLKY